MIGTFFYILCEGILRSMTRPQRCRCCMILSSPNTGEECEHKHKQTSIETHTHLYRCITTHMDTHVFIYSYDHKMFTECSVYTIASQLEYAITSKYIQCFIAFRWSAPGTLPLSVRGTGVLHVDFPFCAGVNRLEQPHCLQTMCKSGAVEQHCNRSPAGKKKKPVLRPLRLQCVQVERHFHLLSIELQQQPWQMICSLTLMLLPVWIWSLSAFCSPLYLCASLPVSTQ